jgi:hypothetical protein
MLQIRLCIPHLTIEIRGTLDLLPTGVEGVRCLSGAMVHAAYRAFLENI